MFHASSFLPLATAAAVVLTMAPASGQLTDLQPGRNFNSEIQFGAGATAGRSENVDAGDIDLDGDMDVGIANGGDGSAQLNRIYINMGGLQAGSVGTFDDQTGTRFAGVAVDTSRDIEFMDHDADGDLDVYITNRGTTANGGEPSRFYVNLGGAQAGTLGMFAEDTDARWGTLVSVALGDQVLGGNQGPFRDFSCDCDFGDLDDDGDLDLFHSSYGPNITAGRDSLVFMNDGTGTFDELWPWAGPGADIEAHVMDLDIADLDGDFDLDVFMSSRDSQARVFQNNLYEPITGTPFHDVTVPALVATGATLIGTGNYECEYGDIDGDGDFDIVAKNYANFFERVLLNDSNETGGPTITFNMKTDWILGDPNVDENEVDFVDFDGDGDKDMFVANFSGENYLYYSGLAQGLDGDVDGLFHRAGGPEGQAQLFPELSEFSNGGQTLDGDVADIDNDGDDDLLVSNDVNQPNRLFRNIGGVPDTHAPVFPQITQLSSVPNGSETVIHARIDDNTAYYVMAFYDADLVYAVDGGPETSVDMFAQGGQQFRGVIPDSPDATVQYRVEVTDMAGNTGVSDTLAYRQGTGSDPWTDLGFALGGVSGDPSLVGTGSLVVGTPGTLTLSNAAPTALTNLFISLGPNTPTAFKGGTLAPVPVIAALAIVTDGAGGIPLAWAEWPSGLGSGTTLTMQYGIDDAAAVAGVSLSNALQADTP